MQAINKNHSKKMKKQLWIMVKQFLLYLFLDQVLLGLYIIAIVIAAIAKGVRPESVLETIESSNSFIYVMVFCYLLTIAIFLGKRYVKLKLGHLAKSNLWKTILFALLIAWGWMFVEVALLELTGFDKLFPDEEEGFTTIGKIMTSSLGMIAISIFGPITEEIAFRGVVLGGLLRMRCNPWVAIIISALVFSICHGTYTQLIGTTVFGIICGWLYWRTKSLWPSIIAHVTNNTTACILLMIEDDPEAELSKLTCILFLVCFTPLLVIGIRWFHQEHFKQ